MSENNNSTGKRLLRVRQGRLVAGVCAGLSRYFGVDVNLFRLAFGVFTVFYGLGFLLYLIAWLVLPEEDNDNSILESIINKSRGPRL
jgi:phage shock protein PspC (stress-responsive transcriptional regulator)